MITPAIQTLLNIANIESAAATLTDCVTMTTSDITPDYDGGNPARSIFFIRFFATKKNASGDTELPDSAVVLNTGDPNTVTSWTLDLTATADGHYTYSLVWAQAYSAVIPYNLGSIAFDQVTAKWFTSQANLNEGNDLSNQDFWIETVVGDVSVTDTEFLVQNDYTDCALKNCWGKKNANAVCECCGDKQTLFLKKLEARIDAANFRARQGNFTDAQCMLDKATADCDSEECGCE